MQVAAVDDDIGRAVPRLDVLEVEAGQLGAVDGVLHDDVLRGDAEAPHLVEQAPVLEDAGAVRGDLQAGAHLAELGRPLEDPHAQALLGEGEGVGEAADAAADDDDVGAVRGVSGHDESFRSFRGQSQRGREGTAAPSACSPVAGRPERYAVSCASGPRTVTVSPAPVTAQVGRHRSVPGGGRGRRHRPTACRDVVEQRRVEARGQVGEGHRPAEVDGVHHDLPRPHPGDLRRRHGAALGGAHLTGPLLGGQGVERSASRAAEAATQCRSSSRAAAPRPRCRHRAARGRSTSGSPRPCGPTGRGCRGPRRSRQRARRRGCPSSQAAARPRAARRRGSRAP